MNTIQHLGIYEHVTTSWTVLTRYNIL